MNSAKRVSNNTIKKNDALNEKRTAQSTHKNKLAIGVISVCAAIAVILIGLICWEDLHPRVIFTVNGEKVCLSDMMFDIYMSEQTGQYMDQLYRQNYGSSYWDAESSDGMTNAEMLKDNTLESAMQRAMMYDEAVAAGYTLTDDENNTVEENASSSFDQLTAEIKNRTGLTKDLIKKYYERKTLADRYKQDWIDTFDINDDEIKAGISAEDYRQYDIQYYYIPYTRTDDQGQSVAMTDDEKKAAMDELKAAYDDIKSLDDFSTYIDTSSDSADTSDGESAEPTATPAPGPKAPEGTNIKYTTKSFIETDTVSDFDDVLLAEIKAMDKGAIMDKVLEDSNGCYIIKMVDNDSKERYNSECESAVEEAENKEFEEKIGELEADKYTIELNDKEWDKVNFGKITIN